MRKRPPIDGARLKAAVQAIKDRKRPDMSRARLPQHSEIVKLRRNLGKRLQPLYADAGLNVSKIDQILTQHHAEVRRILKKHKAETAKNLSALSKIYRRGIDNTRKAVEQIASKPLITTPIPISTPYLIYATPVEMLHDSHIEPWNNWAKLTYMDNRDTAGRTVTLNFYFAWQNPSNYLAVINCDTDLVANGVIQAGAQLGLFFPGSSSLTLSAQLTVFLGQTAIGWQGTEYAGIGSVSAHGGHGIIRLGDVETTPISGGYHLSCSNIEVQPNQIVVFEVAVVANYWIDHGGDIVLDFDFDPGNYEIVCPALTIGLLTPPTITGQLGVTTSQPSAF